MQTHGNSFRRYTFYFGVRGAPEQRIIFKILPDFNADIPLTMDISSGTRKILLSGWIHQVFGVNLKRNPLH
jgi:hypothetical protein